MTVPEKQWQERLGNLMEEYYRVDRARKRLRKQQKELRAMILRIMKQNGRSRIILRGLEALYVVRKKLPEESALRKFFGRFWKVVARRRIIYDILKDEVERLIREGKIDRESYENILIPEDVLIVKPAKEY